MSHQQHQAHRTDGEVSTQCSSGYASRQSLHTPPLGRLPSCSMVEQQCRFSPCAGAAQHQGGSQSKNGHNLHPGCPCHSAQLGQQPRLRAFRQPTSSRHTRRQQTLTLLVPAAGVDDQGVERSVCCRRGQRRAGVSAEPCLKGAGEPRSLQQREGGSRCSDAQRLAVWIAGRNLLAGESALGGVSQALASHGRGALPSGSTRLRTCSPVLSHLRLAGTP